MLVGRGEHLATALALVSQGTPVCVVGEAGSGKTALLGEIATRLERPTAVGGALRLLRDVQLLPLRRALRTGLRGAPAEVATEIAAQLPGGVLLLDDLQWADDATLDALPAIAAATGLVLTLRLGEEADAARSALAECGASEVAVDPLTAEAAAALVRELAPHLDAAGAIDLARAAGCNPRVISELVNDGSCSARLSDALAQQVDGRSRQDLQLLTILAAHGGPLKAEDAPGWEGLVADHLAVVEAGCVRLRLDLFGQAAQSQLSPEEQTAVHARLASLSDTAVARVEHLFAAGEASEAAHLALAEAPTASPADRATLLALAAEHARNGDGTGLLAGAADAALAVGRIGSARALADRAVQAGEGAVAAATAAVARAQDLDPHAALAAADLVPAEAPASARCRAAAARASALAWPLWRPVEARATASEAMALSGADGDPEARRSRGLAALVAGDPAWREDAEHLAAARVWAELLDGAASAGDPAAHGDLVAAVLTMHADGDCDAATGRLRSVLQRRARPVERELATAHLAVALADSGRSGEAVVLAADALAGDHSPIGGVILAWALAEAELSGGRLGRARDAASRAVEALPDPSPVASLAAVVAAWAAADAPAGAMPVPPAPDSPWIATRAASLEVDAVAALAAADLESARSGFEGAARGWAWHRRGALRCQWAVAEVDRRAGSTDRAVEGLRRVEVDAAALGQRPLLARARMSLRRAGASPARAPNRGRGPLSAREVEVLELVRAGFTAGEAAAVIGVSQSTVETQIESAMRKLDARTRLHAIALFDVTACPT